MSKLPIVSGRQAIKVLEEFEFRVDRIKGSHSVMVKDGHPALVTVPFAQRTKTRNAARHNQRRGHHG